MKSLKSCWYVWNIDKSFKKRFEKKYLKLSKKFHPDMQTGSEEKFLELKKSYDLLCAYMDSYYFSFDKDEFKHQFPAFTNYKIGLNKRRLLWKTLLNFFSDKLYIELTITSVLFW